jgi:hypothetical protein
VFFLSRYILYQSNLVTCDDEVLHDMGPGDEDIIDLSGGIATTQKLVLLDGWIIEVLIGAKFYIYFLRCETEFYK